MKPLQFESPRIQTAGFAVSRLQPAQQPTGCLSGYPLLHTAWLDSRIASGLLSFLQLLPLGNALKLV